MQTQEIRDLVFNAVSNLGVELDIEALKAPNLNTLLYTSGGNLDSLGLVGFISELEELISEEFGKDIILANDRAMSAKNSPFKDIASLISYIEECVNENK
ncbi:hypothetical protein DMB95_00660 [Campylobacter sp. MIT 12-8780]|uniref:hypothetical protein n=1 Tax=unclassified Campylobacter TaxID=2593542 RepID=UPI00115CCA45|nr:MULTISPECIES: hypothetical protein [unclassified Campylobacter]NDJ26473.1 hypothetical protein [Campylobacter sp. MIT 19-121]TQR43043.1 hypothetical protein DMB95_00660 [Campylobacter sp. MIT 12-8780]